MFQTSRLGSPQLEATFDTIIEVFLFLDKSGNGNLNKKDMVKALNETSPWEKSPSHITKSRFSINCFTGCTLNFILFLYFLNEVFFFFLVEFLLISLFSFQNMQKKWTGTKMGRSVSGSSSLLSLIGLELTWMKICL